MNKWDILKFIGVIVLACIYLFFFLVVVIKVCNHEPVGREKIIDE